VVGQEDQKSRAARRVHAPTYQRQQDAVRESPVALQVHALPACFARRPKRPNEVMDHPRSIIFDQSENRLHTEKGLLVLFCIPSAETAFEELKAYHKGQIEALLNDPKFGK